MPQRDHEELTFDTCGELVTTGSANAYAVQIAQSVETYYQGLRICAKANHSNTGAATLNVNGLGAAAIRKNTSAALVTGDILSGQYYDFVYDFGNGWFQILNPSPSPNYVSGPASATDDAIARFDGTSGKLIQDSAVTINDSGEITTTGTKIEIRGSGNCGIELGRVDGSSSTPFLDFHSGATAVDYDARIIASGGTGSSQGGTLNFAAAALQFAGTNLFATQTAQEAASSNSVTVTPGRQHFHPGHPKAWVKFDAATAINQDYGVASLSDNGSGDTTVNFDTAFSAATYTIIGSARRDVTNNSIILAVTRTTAPTTTAARVITVNFANNGEDSSYASAIFTGDQ